MGSLEPLQEEADEDANIIFGAVIDEQMAEEIRVTVIATGFNKNVRLGKLPSRSTAEITPIKPQVSELEQRVAAGAVDMIGETAGVHEATDHVARPRPALHHERMERSTLRELVSEIGLNDYQEDEYDIPTFLRKQAD